MPKASTQLQEKLYKLVLYCPEIRSLVTLAFPLRCIGGGYLENRGRLEDPKFVMQVTLTTLLDGWVREGQLGEAECVLKSMSDRSIPANRITYNTLLRGYAMAGDLRVSPACQF